jgi:hypothetical protein
MNNKWRTVLLIVFSVFLVMGAFAQNIQRLSAQFKNFDGTETSTTIAAAPTGAGGMLVYTKAVVVPFLSGGQMMYITISAVGDDHFGESNFLSCNVDGPGGVGTPTTVCNPTPTTFGIDLAPPGWIGMTHHFQYQTTYCSNGACGLTGGDGGGGQGDEHDNDYYYTWCKPISPGTHVVNLRLGNKTGLATNRVFFEKAFFYIDVSNTPPFGACNKGLP